MSRSRTIWEKFDIEEYKASRLASLMPNATVAESSSQDARRWPWMQSRLSWMALNWFAALFWLYVLLKLFVSDIDRWFISSFSPSRGWILDFRFFILLTLVTIVVLVARWWHVTGILIYFWLFPLVVLLWKVPRLYYRRRSWNLVIGTFQVLWSLGQSLRFTLGALTAFTLSMLTIALDSPIGLLWCAVVILLALWISLVFRAVVYAIVPSKFLVFQQKILSAILESDRTWSLAELPVAAKDSAVTHLQKGQIDQLVNQASWGLLLYGGSAHWAEKLDHYRKSGASVVFSAFSVVALVTQAMILFAFINLGLYRIDESQFDYSEKPQFVTFVRYSLSSMYAGEIEALHAVGTGASLANVVEAFSCAVIVVIFVVSLHFSHKQTQENRVAEESIQAMQQKADAFAQKLAGEYNLPLEDFVDRISELGGFFSEWARRLVYTAVVVRKRVGEEG